MTQADEDLRPVPGVAIRPGDNAATRALLDATDWSATSLGLREAWPASLRSYVDLVMGLPSPAIVFWGDDQAQIYNDGYAVIMGPRHPRYFGAPYRESWPDTYPVIYPWMRRVLDAGEIVTVDRSEIMVTRYGFPEEAYFTFTFSPLRDDEGRITGIFQPVVEVTAQVLADRRAESLRALADQIDAIDPFGPPIGALATEPRDIPFALVYRWDADADALRLAGHTESLTDDAAALDAVAGRARAVYEGGQAMELSADEIESLVHADAGPWPEPTRRAIAMPMPGFPDRPTGVAVFGISPRLHFDDAYRAFLGQVAAQLGAAFARGELRRSEQDARAELDVAHRSIRHRTAQFEQLLGMAPVGVYLVDAHFRIREVNPVARPFFEGIRDLIGRDFRDVVRRLHSPERAEALIEIFRDVLETGESHAETEQPQQRPGTDRTAYFEWRVDRIPLPDGGNGAVCYFRDVSEQILARRALEDANRRKDEFLAMLGHELRNPMAPIRASAQLLRMSGTTPETRERAVDIIERQTRHLTRLVDDLLDVSRIMQGKVTLVPRRVELAAIVDQAAETVRPFIDARGHTLTIDVPRGGLQLEADETRMVQVVGNLLNNASKFTPERGSISVSARPDGDQVCLEVRDDGIGMPAELIPDVFELFVQGRPSLDRSHGGLGIGLTLVRQLVRLHGGEVTAESDGVDRGSVFTVRLAAVSAPVPLDGDGASARGGADRLRVLVVDDNVDMAETTAALLEMDGHEIDITFDGPSAVERVEAFQPSVVLCDIGLPGMDGYELATHLRARYPDLRLIALTGYGHDDARRDGERAGFDHYLVKPVDFQLLSRLLHPRSADRSDGSWRADGTDGA
ncbi:MAG TPA: ATP-binding protein [Candidatus Limnocylindria bacterium]|nr:ATP-binding protein [Candidatus Limnocylindria bacterium]